MKTQFSVGLLVIAAFGLIIGFTLFLTGDRLRNRGEVFETMVVAPKGEPGNFLTEAELRAKFHGLADAILGENRAAELADATLGLDKAADVTALTRLGTPQAALRMAGE